jgi:nicotinamide-nucleotide amidase
MRTSGHAVADALGALAEECKLTVGVAESLTGGRVASTLAAVTGSAEWFRGAVVAYSPDVKRGLLGVGAHPVVSKPTAEEMAVGAARCLDADITVSLTGVGGPDPQDGIPPGTVWMAVHRRPERVSASLEQFDGDPDTVCEKSVERALELLVAELLDARAKARARARAATP